MMFVSDAIASRFSARAFLDTPVSIDTIQKILDHARWAPSGGNIQPWKVHVVTGDAKAKLSKAALDSVRSHPDGETPEYLPYPTEWKQPYKNRRFAIGMALYDAMGIDRRDKQARTEQLLANYEFFNAPIGLIFSIDKTLWPGQLGDMGMYIQNVMLLAREHGLHTCPQQIWQFVNRTVHQVLDISDDYTIYCGMSLGYLDTDNNANKVVRQRGELDDFALFHGFE